MSDRLGLTTFYIYFEKNSDPRVPRIKKVRKAISKKLARDCKLVKVKSASGSVRYKTSVFKISKVKFSYQELYELLQVFKAFSFTRKMGAIR